MVQLTREETVKTLSIIIDEILGTAGLNLLGQYELKNGTQTIATVPSIKIDYPRLSQDIPRSLVPESGIEAIIYPDPDIVFRNHSTLNTQSQRYYMIALDQWHPTQGLVEAVEALKKDRRLNLEENPSIVGTREKSDGSGFLPPRAILYLRQTHFVQGS